MRPNKNNPIYVNKLTNHLDSTLYATDLEEYCDELEKIIDSKEKFITEMNKSCNYYINALNVAIMYIAKKENRKNADVRDWLLTEGEKNEKL